MERNSLNNNTDTFYHAKKGCKPVLFSRKSNIKKFFLLLFIFSSGLIGFLQSVKAIELPKPATLELGRVEERITAPGEEEFESRRLPRNGVGFEQKPQFPVQPPEEVEAVKFKLSAITIEGATIYKNEVLAKYYQPYIGKNVSLADLQNIASRITLLYRNDGYVLSRAIIPVQQIVAGRVQIQVVEGYIAEIYVEGEIGSVRSKIEQYGKKIKSMRPLQIKYLERYILLLNGIQGLTVKTVLSPSLSAVGAADLTFVVEQKRIAGDLYYDNRGTRYMGPGQAIGSISASDALLPADTLTLQTIDTPVHSELRYWQANYIYPIGTTGLNFKINGSLTETNPGFVIKDLDLVGRAKTWGLGLEYPLLRRRNKNLWVYGKFDWLDSYTNWDFVTLFKDHIRSVRFGASYDFSDRKRGYNLVDIELSKGLKFLGASPINPVTPLSRYKGRSDYTKIHLNLSRYQSLGERLVLLVAAVGQYSFNQPLLSAEEFGFGGQQFGRAYDPSEVTGDSGLAGKLEMRFNAYPNLKLLQQIQYFVYYDIGVVWNVGEDLGLQLPKDSGSDIGGGMRVNFNPHIHCNFEVSKPLTRKVDTQVAVGKEGYDLRFYFGLGAKL